MSSSSIPRKPELLSVIDRAWRALRSTLDRLPAAALTGPHDPAGWTALDHVIHMAAWEASALCLLQGRPRHLGLGVEEDLYVGASFDDVNREIHRRTQDLSPSQALAWLDNAHAAFVAALEPLGDADMGRLLQDFLPATPADDRRPLARFALENSAEHFEEHRGWIEALAARA